MIVQDPPSSAIIILSAARGCSCMCGGVLTLLQMKEIGEIELSIQGGTDEIEALGEAGKVEESMEKLQAVDALKNLKVDKEKELQMLNETAGASGHQKLRVCETCVSDLAQRRGTC